MAKFALTITTPEGPLYEGEVELVTVPGIEGRLGFLAHHAGYMAGLKAGIVSVFQSKSDAKPKESFEIQGGQAFFQDNKCVVCVSQKH